MKQLASALALLGCVIGPSLPAAAESGGGFTGATPTGPGAAVTVGRSEPGGDGGGSEGSPYSGCVADELALASVIGGIDGWLGTGTDVTTSGSLSWMSCTRLNDGTIDSFLAGIPVPVTQLAVTLARAQLAVGVSDVDTAPPEGGLQLVGVPVWFWVADQDTATATATIPGLSATVAATPTSTTLRFPDGSTKTCADGGTPWRRGVGGQAQHSDCTHTFQTKGAQRVEVSVDWQVTWTATNGAAGTLPAITRTTGVDLPLQEGQAVTD